MAAHCFEAFDCGPCSNKDRLAILDSAGHDVETMVQAVNEVDIGVATFEVKGTGAGRFSPGKGVTGAIGSAEIGLGFDDFEDEAAIFGEVSNEIASEEVWGDDLG